MLRILRSPAPPALNWNAIGDAVLNWGFLRMGLNRPHSIEELPDDLRRDVGLLPREKGHVDPRDLRW